MLNRNLNFLTSLCNVCSRRMLSNTRPILKKKIENKFFAHKEPLLQTALMNFKSEIITNNKKADISILINNYTAPALATALRDREKILATAAYFLKNGKMSELEELINPFYKKLENTTSVPFYSHLENTTTTTTSDSDFSSADDEDDDFIVDDSLAEKRITDESTTIADTTTTATTRTINPPSSAKTNEHQKLVKQIQTWDRKLLRDIRKRLRRMPRYLTKETNRRASVLLPLCISNGKPSILFNLRSKNLKKHPGQVCFPGGMVDDDDLTISHTALREFQEEMGIKKENVEVLGLLRCDWSEIAAYTGVAVTPVIGYMGDLSNVNINMNSDEVQKWFTVPLEDLLLDENWERREVTAPVFMGSSDLIWGLTAYICDQFINDVLVPALHK